MAEKPTLEAVLKYAEPLVMKFISQYALDLPEEQKEEIHQTAKLRLFLIYPTIEDTGWKSFVYHHSRGAVLDYLKLGVGFQEAKWSIAKLESNESKNVHKARERVYLSDSENEHVALDTVLGANGVFSEMGSSTGKIRWELVARMASIDECIHAMARYILGEGLEEMSPGFDKCRSRMGQLIQAFVNRFDDPMEAESMWFLQTCYAFGLCEVMGLPDIDQSEVQGHPVGWTLRPLDLERTPIQEPKPEQLDLFDEED